MSHQTDDPWHDTAYCGHCRTDRADGLAAYRAWLATAPATAFEPDQPTPARPTGAREPRVYVYAQRDWTGTLAATGRWRWSLYDENAERIDSGVAESWTAAHTVARAALADHAVRSGLAAALAGRPW